MEERDRKRLLAMAEKHGIDLAHEVLRASDGKPILVAQSLASFTVAMITLWKAMNPGEEENCDLFLDLVHDVFHRVYHEGSPPPGTRVH
jgi:hypothetical protein